MSTNIKEVRARRPKARNKDVVYGAITECLSMAADAKAPEEYQARITRVRELFDELMRAYKGVAEEE